jgi:hypothetical protein
VSHRRGVRLFVLLALGACTDVPPSPLPFTTLDGSAIAPLDVPPGHLRVLVFVSHDCPIANAYAPEIERLWQQLRGPAVDFLLVHCDPDLDATAARQHAREHALTLPIVLDPQQQLARAVGATVTPEAAVLTHDGVQYLGRIDDRWRGFGQDGQVAEHDDLRQAVAALRAGRSVENPRTRAIGCQLPDPRR